MKKLCMIAVCLLALCGCAKNETAMVSGHDEVLIASEKGNFTKQDLFEAMKNNDYSGIILNDIVSKIVTKEGLNVEDLEKQVDERINKMKETYGSYYDSLVNYYGGEEMIRTNVYGTICTENLTGLYIDSKFDEMVKENLPIKMQMAYFDTLEAAEKVIEEVKNGASFDVAVLNNGYSANAQPKIYLDSDSMAIEVKEYINNTEENGISTVINTMTSQNDADGNSTQKPRYYVINIIDRDANNFKEEFKEKLISSFDKSESLNHFFNKYDIEFYDQRTYDLMSKAYAGLK